MSGNNLYNSPFVANRIKAYAKTKSISLKSILEDCELGSNSFSHMLHGRSLAFDSLAKIADCLDCSVDYLLGRTDNPEVNRATDREPTTIRIAAFGGGTRTILHKEPPLEEEKDMESLRAAFETKDDEDDW